MRIMRRAFRQVRKFLGAEKLTNAQVDAIRVGLHVTLIWALIEWSDICTVFFRWVADHPDYEVDSLLLAFIMSSVGVSAYAVRRYRDVSRAERRRRAAERRIKRLAYHDPLTGLHNRRALIERIESVIAGKPEHREIALMIVDLDRFKAVNDVYGHLAGDRLLHMVADRLVGNLDDGQTAFRLGGDEFAVICEVHDDRELPLRIAHHLVQEMAEPFVDDGLVHHIGASIGIAMYPGDAEGREDLMRRADIALYRAKEAGRGKYRSFEAQMDAEIARRLELEQELRGALSRGELRPYYQPVVNLGTGEIIGFEMLARWPREDGRQVGPDQFVPIAEESGLINHMMLQLLERACLDARGWDPSLRIAINISPVQLKDPWLAQKVLGIVSRCGLPAQRLVIEITENALIADTEHAREIIGTFKAQGMKIALDDFGTGYSSLHHLRMLPFDRIKIDRSYVLAIDSDPEALKIVKAIVGLANCLDMPVIAEGVETEAIARRLGELGCMCAQGYYFGRPMPAEDVVRLLGQTHAEQTLRAVNG